MQRLLDIKKTQIEIVRDRGYDIGTEAEILDMDSREFKHYIEGLLRANKGKTFTQRSIMSNRYKKIGNESEVISVFYGELKPPEKQISSREIQSFTGTVNNMNSKGDIVIKEVIIIVDGVLSSQANNAIKTQPSDIFYQVFYDSDIRYNPTTHVDTPVHIKLTEEQGIEKLRELMVDQSKLPLMLDSDPIAKYYGWRPGDIIKIIRSDDAVSILAPKSINYRLVTKRK